MSLLVSNIGKDRLTWSLPCFRQYKRVHISDSQFRSIRRNNVHRQDALILFRGGGFMDLACLLVHHKTFEKKGSFK